MKTADFSRPGGLKFNQSHLDWMQQSYMEIARVIALMCSYGVTDPVIIAGMEYDGLGLTAGAFVVGNRLYLTDGGSLDVEPGPGYTRGLIVNETAIDEVFTNGSTWSVKIDDSAIFTAVVNEVTDTSWPIRSFKLMGEVLGARHREEWRSMSVDTGAGFGTVTGILRFRKDFLNNKLYLSGTFTANSPADFNAYPTTTATLVAILPAGYEPARNRSFVCNNASNTQPLDSTSKVYLSQFKGIVTIAGDVAITFVKPALGVSEYTVWVDAEVPLD